MWGQEDVRSAGAGEGRKPGRAYLFLLEFDPCEESVHFFVDIVDVVDVAAEAVVVLSCCWLLWNLPYRFGDFFQGLVVYAPPQEARGQLLAYALAELHAEPASNRRKMSFFLVSIHLYTCV